jgi:type VI secretion system VasD/TssJ family lipoprotein
MTTAILPEHRMVVMIHTAKVLNPDDSAQSAPLSVVLFQLKDTNTFGSADFFALYEKGQATLGASYITVAKVDLTPDTAARLTLDLKPETKFIGVIAAYHNLNNVVWRKIIPVQGSWGREKLHLWFKESGISEYKVFDNDSELKVPTQPNIDPNKFKPTSAQGPNMQYEVLSYGK